MPSRITWPKSGSLFGGPTTHSDAMLRLLARTVTTPATGRSSLRSSAYVTTALRSSRRPSISTMSCGSTSMTAPLSTRARVLTERTPSSLISPRTTRSRSNAFSNSRSTVTSPMAPRWMNLSPEAYPVIREEVTPPGRARLGTGVVNNCRGPARRGVDAVGRCNRCPRGRGAAFTGEQRLEGVEEQQQVFVRGRVAHDANAPHLAGVLAQATRNLDPELIQQARANAGVVHPLWHPDRQDRRQLVGGVGEQLDLQRIEPGGHRARSQHVAGETLLQALLGDEAQRFVSRIDHVDGRSVVTSALLGKPVFIVEQQIQIPAVDRHWPAAN